VPGPNGAQGRRRTNQARVGQPRDQDGRPQGAVERRGGRTYKPGLHDWTPGAPGRRADRPGDGATGRLQRPSETDNKSESRGAAGFGRSASGRISQGAEFGPRRMSGLRQSAPDSAPRPGSMGGPAAGSQGSENRGGPPPAGEGRGPARAWQPKGTVRTGMTGGGTRYGSEEPRDGTDRSRYGRYTQVVRPQSGGSSGRGGENGNQQDGQVPPRSGRPVVDRPYRQSIGVGDRNPRPAAQRPQSSGPGRRPGFTPRPQGRPVQRVGTTGSPNARVIGRQYADLDHVDDAGSGDFSFRDGTDEVASSGELARANVSRHEQRQLNADPGVGVSEEQPFQPVRTHSPRRRTPRT
jgi:hypothetical protein